MKIVLCGYYGFGNLGDELILKNIITDIRTFDPRIEIAVLSADSEATANQNFVRYIPRWNLLRVIRLLMTADWFVLGGGGLIQDKTSFWSPLYYWGLCCLAKITGASVATYAVSIESLSCRLNRWLNQWIFTHIVDVITVRDESTKKNLIEMRISPDKIKRVPDPVFGEDVSAHPQSPGDRILMIPRFPLPHAAQPLFFDDKRTAAFWLLQPAIETELFPKEFRSFLLKNGELQEIFRDVTLVISARFHGLLLALLLGIPFVGIGDEHKVGRFCREWGFPFLPWDARPEELNSALTNAQENLKSVDWKKLAQFKTEAHQTPVLIFSGDVAK